MSVVSADFIAVGKPDYIRAASGVTYLDISTGVKYKQVTIPSGKNWVVIATGLTYTPPAGGGAVNSVGATAPLTSSGGANPVIGISYTPENASNKSTSVVADQASNTKYPSVKAVYDWVLSLGYITASALAGYATQAWVTSQGYITNVIAALGYTPENVANKQNNLTVDGLGTKYPTVDAVNAGIATVTAGQTENFNWKFDTATGSADPGTGRFRLNNATLASVTNIYVDSICDQTGLDIDNIFSIIDGSWSIYIQETGDATKFVQFTTSGTYTDNTGWWTIPVTFVQSGAGGLFTNNAKCTWYLVNRNSSGGSSSTDAIVYAIALG